MAAMPWCTHCNKFLTPSTVRPDATCPKCGKVVERGLIPGMTTRPADEAPPAVPWHLKLMGSALAVYLGYRFLQLISWVLHR
jgi:phage FluMu protein Com